MTVSGWAVTRDGEFSAAGIYADYELARIKFKRLRVTDKHYKWKVIAVNITPKEDTK